MFDEIINNQLKFQMNLLDQLKAQVMHAPPSEQAKFNAYILRIKKVFELPVDEQTKAITEIHNEFINHLS